MFNLGPYYRDEVAADLFGNSSLKLCCHFEYFKIDVDHSCTRKVFQQQDQTSFIFSDKCEGEIPCDEGNTTI